MEWDEGPKGSIAGILGRAPLDAYRANTRFRHEWGPMYYRGRLDGSAKVLVIGQDPAADENVARRCMVGTAGQRVQGFLRKIGLTRSYVIFNSVLYSIYGQFDKKLETFIDSAEVESWRNEFLDALVSPNLKAIVAFGLAAKHVVQRWPGSQGFQEQGRVFHLTHPTARPVSAIFKSWNPNLSKIAAVVPPDADGQVDTTPYAGASFKNADLQRIPVRDFPFGAPAWMGQGNIGMRLTTSNKVPAIARTNPTIFLIASGDQG